MRKILIAGTLAVAALAAAAPAQASCFYNQSEISSVGVRMVCGLFCRNDWMITKGDRQCRNGEGGPFFIAAEEIGSGANNSLLTGEVADHGYVTITGSCQSGIKAQVWNADHSLARSMSLNGQVPNCR